MVLSNLSARRVNERMNENQISLAMAGAVTDDGQNILANGERASEQVEVSHDEAEITCK